MPHASIQRENGRRHEVDFGDAPVRVSEEIFIRGGFRDAPTGASALRAVHSATRDDPSAERRSIPPELQENGYLTANMSYVT
jgi:hypothetical protein